MTKRILGVDLGDVRTGLAVSDVLGFMASGIGYEKNQNITEAAKKVTSVALEYDVCKIVVGLPVNMNGTEGPRAEKVRKFAEILGKMTKLPIELFDERCTTMSAHVYLNETNIKSKKRKGVIDTLSAQIILQNYLDSHKNQL